MDLITAIKQLKKMRDEISNRNMTSEEYDNLQAIKFSLNYLEKSLENIRGNNSKDDTDEIGCNEIIEPESTPMIPINQEYYGRDMTTYGKCPICKGVVTHGYPTNDKCPKCGQKLKW